MPVNGQYRDSVSHCNVIHLMKPEQIARSEAAYTRRIIRKSDFTRAERDVLIALVNLWFYHRNGKKGFIHPGRKLLAKKAKSCEKTVSRAITSFKSIGFIKAVRFPNGGTGCATQFIVSLQAIWRKLDPDGVKILPGELAALKRITETLTVSFDNENVPVSEGQNVPLSIVTYKGVLTDFDSSGGDA